MATLKLYFICYYFSNMGEKKLCKPGGTIRKKKVKTQLWSRSTLLRLAKIILAPPAPQHVVRKYLPVIEEGWGQKPRQRSSHLFEGQNLINFLAHYL